MTFRNKAWRAPMEYKIIYCTCGKKLRYLTEKQLNFVLRMHQTSGRHHSHAGWQPSLMSNAELSKALKESLSEVDLQRFL